MKPHVECSVVCLRRSPGSERIDDAALSTQLRLRASLKALKYVLRRDLAECMNILLAEVPWLDFEDVIRNLIYT